MTSAPLWHPGLNVAGRYRLRARIGAGASGEVWRALDTSLEAPVAIKLLDPSLAGTEIAKRFLREAKAAAKLRSLHVVQILDHGVHGETPYIAMELLDGETLASRLDRDHHLAPRLACRMVEQVAKAATKAHAAGIVHRDLKPDNVFLVHDDDGEPMVKVFDFGIAKVTPTPGGPVSTNATLAGTLLGTPQYMSPEQATGTSVDFRTDLYALGIVAFECITGQLPFRLDVTVPEILQLAVTGKLLRPSHVAKVPPGFDAWFAKGTAFHPHDRFGSAKEMAVALRELLFE